MHGFEDRSPSLANWERQVQDILFARAMLLVESETGREKKKTTRTVFSWAHNSQGVQLQVSYGCKSAAWAVLQQT